MPITAPWVDQRTTGEATRDLAIRLDVAIELAAGGRANVGAEHADRAQRGAGGAARPTECEREIADGEPVDVAQLRGRKSAAGNAQQCDVSARIAADDFGVAFVEAAVAGDADRGAVRV
jgi:hypothetical protein